MSFRIAIPSHGRATIFFKNTYDVLSRCGVNWEKVYVFLSDNSEHKEYCELMPELNYIISECENLTDKFNYIHNHFPKGEKVLVMEDDIKEIILKTWDNDNSYVNVENDDLFGMVEQGFNACKDSDCNLFGIAPHSNPFYMSHEISTTFKFVVAQFFGFISTHQKSLEVRASCKSDYERTILYFVEHGKIVRLNYLGVKTKNYKNEGGLQSLGDKRLKLEKDSCDYLVKRFPHLVSHNEKKKSVYPELKLKQMRPKKDVFMDWKAYQGVMDRSNGF